MLSLNQIKETVSRIGAKYRIKNAYLFGSYATGHASENSDIDLLIDRGEIRDFATLSDFRFDLMDALGVDVDVLTTAGIKDNFFKLIKNDRILLYGA